MTGRNVKPLPCSRVRLLSDPFIYENAKRWLWKSEYGTTHYNLWICQSGHARFRFSGGADFEIRPWTVLLIPPGVGYCGWTDGEVPDFTNFGAHWMPEGVDSEEPFAEPFVLALKETDTAEALIRSILRLSTHGDLFGQQQAEWLLLSLLALVWREHQLPWDSPADSVIRKQVGRIRTGEGLFTDVASLAREANMSRVHYSRRFKRAVGLSPNQFLVRQRMQRSAILLQETDWTLEQVADAVGYADPHYFSRQFKGVMGITPGAYRERQEKSP